MIFIVFVRKRQRQGLRREKKRSLTCVNEYFSDKHKQPEAGTRSYLAFSYKDYISLLVVLSGNIKVGLKVLASS
jgi:hypothetical protein